MLRGKMLGLLALGLLAVIGGVVAGWLEQDLSNNDHAEAPVDAEREATKEQAGLEKVVVPSRVEQAVPSSARPSFLVVDESGCPLQGVGIGTIRSFGAKVEESIGRTDATGHLIVGSTLSKHLCLLFQKQGFCQEVVDCAMLDWDSALSESGPWQVVMHRSTGISITVQDSAGSPVEDARVEAKLARFHDRVMDDGSTDSMGQCVIEVCLSGHCTIDVSAFGFVPARHVLRESNLQPESLTFRLGSILVAAFCAPSDGSGRQATTGGYLEYSVTGLPADVTDAKLSRSARREIDVHIDGLAAQRGLGEAVWYAFFEGEDGCRAVEVPFTYIPSEACAAIRDTFRFVPLAELSPPDILVFPMLDRQVGLGELEVSFLDDRGLPEIPAARWAVVSASDPRFEFHPNGLRRVKDDSLAAESSHIFMVPEGDYVVRCVAGMLWGHTFEPRTVSVQAGLRSVVRIELGSGEELGKANLRLVDEQKRLLAGGARIFLTRFKKRPAEGATSAAATGTGTLDLASSLESISVVPGHYMFKATTPWGGRSANVFAYVAAGAESEVELVVSHE